MNLNLLIDAGIALYGEQWLGRMAILLGLSTRQLSRYVNEKHPLPEVLKNGTDIAEALVTEILHKQAVCNELLSRLLKDGPR